MEGAAAGCEKLKPGGPGWAPVVVEKTEAGVLLPMELELVWDTVLPKGELVIAVVWGLAGSGLALKMGLKSASLAGLNVDLDDPKPRLWVTLGVVPNPLVVTLVDEGCPNTDCPKPGG